jgi:hypothetical protein
MRPPLLLETLSLRRTLAALVVGGLVAATGCTPADPMPLSANAAVHVGSGEALVAYLAQPEATPSICDLHAKEDHVRVFTPDMGPTLVGALDRGTLPIEPFRQCALRLVKTLPSDSSATLFDAMAHAYRGMLRDARLDTDPARLERITALQTLYLDRKPGLGPHASVEDSLFRDLRAALAPQGDTPKLGTVATRLGQEMLDAYDLARGLWQGRPVDIALMDTLVASGNEAALARFAARLPTEDLRTEARRRIVRIHIALSPFPDVQHGGAALEDRVLKEGHAAVSLALHPLVRASLFAPPPMRDVVIREQVFDRMATLLGHAKDQSDLSPLPEMPLRGALSAELSGVSHLVGVCAKASALDPSPCIAPADLAVDNPLTSVDKNGALRFAEGLRIDQILPFASEAAFTVPVRVGDAPAVTLSWELHFERPENLAFFGAALGRRGPDVTVRITQLRPGRFRFDASTAEIGRAGAAEPPYTAIVESPDLTKFRVKSLGGSELFGAAGAGGAPGSNGSACGSGGNGGDGGPGDTGGAGGERRRCERRHRVRRRHVRRSRERAPGGRPERRWERRRRRRRGARWRGRERRRGRTVEHARRLERADGERPHRLQRRLASQGRVGRPEGFARAGWAGGAGEGADGGGCVVGATRGVRGPRELS